MQTGHWKADYWDAPLACNWDETLADKSDDRRASHWVDLLEKRTDGPWVDSLASCWAAVSGDITESLSGEHLADLKAGSRVDWKERSV